MIKYLQEHRILRVEVVCESMGFEATPNNESTSYRIENPFIVITYRPDFSCKFNLNNLIGYKDLGDYVILYFNQNPSIMSEPSDRGRITGHSKRGG